MIKEFIKLILQSMILLLIASLMVFVCADINEKISTIEKCWQFSE